MNYVPRKAFENGCLLIVIAEEVYELMPMQPIAQTDFDSDSGIDTADEFF